MGEPVLKQIIKEHRPLDPSRALRLAGARPSRGFICSCCAASSWREVRVTWLLPLVWLVQAFDRCRHAPLFVGGGARRDGRDVAAHPLGRVARAESPRLLRARGRASANARGGQTVWLPALAVLTALALQVARVPVPVIGAGWAKHITAALAGRASRRAQGERTEARRAEPPLQRLQSTADSSSTTRRGTRSSWTTAAKCSAASG